MASLFLRFPLLLVPLTGAGTVLGFILSRVAFNRDDPIFPGIAFNLGPIDYHVQGLVLILFSGILVFLFWMAPKLAKNEEPWFFKILIAAFFTKIAVSFFRLYWVWVVKGGADTRLYFGTGTRYGPQIRQLDFDFVTLFANPGTDFTQLYAAFVMAITGPTLPGVFLFYSFLSFMAAVFYYKAFVIGFPNGNRKLFAGLMFFFPSWIYWTSNVGKDAPVALFISLVAYGAALLYTKGSLKSWLILGIGIIGVITIRPHVGGILALAVSAPLMLRPPVKSKSLAPLIRVGYLLVGLVFAYFMINNAADYLKLEETSIEATLSKYDSFQSRAERGGASFAPTPITDPLGIPMAFITLLFRPFPFEAHNSAALVLSLEGIITAVLLIGRAGAIRRGVFAIFSNPYALFVILYVFIFTLAFTTIGNFSLLGRQRLMALPIFFMLFSYATSREERSLKESAHDDSPEEAEGARPIGNNMAPNLK